MVPLAQIQRNKDNQKIKNKNKPWLRLKSKVCVHTNTAHPERTKQVLQKFQLTQGGSSLQTSYLSFQLSGDPNTTHDEDIPPRIAARERQVQDGLRQAGAPSVALLGRFCGSANANASESADLQLACTHAETGESAAGASSTAHVPATHRSCRRNRSTRP